MDFKVKQFSKLVQSQPPKCVACNGQKAASCFCKDCQDYLCKTCASSHKAIPIFKEHYVVLTDTFARQCKIHPVKLKEYYCEECKDIFCSACITCGHDKHGVFNLQEHVNNCRKTAKRKLEKLDLLFPEKVCDDLLHKKGFKKIKTAMAESTNKMTRAIQESAASLTKEIEKQAKELSDLANSHHNMLMRKLECAEQFKNVDPLKEKFKTVLAADDPLKLLKEFKPLSDELDALMDKEVVSPSLSVNKEVVYAEFKPVKLDICLGSLSTAVFKDFLGGNPFKSPPEATKKVVTDSGKITIISYSN